MTVLKTGSWAKLQALWEYSLLPIGFPLLIGFVLGPALMFLLVQKSWILFFAVSLVIPAAILIIRYPLASMIIWMSILLWFPFDETYKYVYFIIHRMLMPVGLGMLILSRALKLKEYPSIQVKWADISLIIFCSYAIISIFVTNTGLKSILIFQSRMLVPFVGYWLVRISGADEQFLKKLTPLLAVIILGQCIIGLLSWFAPATLPDIWHRRLLGDRVSGTFNGAGSFGSVLLFFMTIIYYQAMRTSKRWWRGLLILVFALGLVCLFFSFTRGVWIASIITILGLIYLYPKLTISLAMIVVLVMLPLLMGPLARELTHATERFQTERTIDSRIVLANAGQLMFMEKPIFGWGYETYDLHDWKFMVPVNGAVPSKWDVQEGTSHNTYMTILAEMGIVGLTFYLLPVIGWLITTFRKWFSLPEKRSQYGKLLIILWLPLVAHLLLAQSGDFRFSTYSVGVFWILLGFLANIVERPLAVIPASSSESYL